MTSRERYRRVLEGLPVDFLPRIPILMHFAAEYLGSDYGAFASDYRVLVEANVKCARDFGIDQLSCISDPYRETQGFGSKIEYLKDGVPRSSHPLREKKDFGLLLRPDSLQSERMFDRIKAVRRYREQYGNEYSILGWIEGPAAEAADLRDVECFCVDLLDDEKYACDLMDLCVEVGIQFAEAQIQAGADTIGIGEAIASQVSPSTYESNIFPREKKLIDSIHRLGAYCRLHICGDITHLLPAISDLGVDIIDVDHMVDCSKVREIVGGGVTIAGNIDPVSDVLHGTAESIGTSFRTIYETVGNPYMVSAGCEIPFGTPKENLMALCSPIPYRK